MEVATDSFRLGGLWERLGWFLEGNDGHERPQFGVAGCDFVPGMDEKANLEFRHLRAER